MAENDVRLKYKKLRNEIFLLDVLTNQLSNKQTMTKIISDKKKIFMY